VLFHPWRNLPHVKTVPRHAKFYTVRDSPNPLIRLRHLLPRKKRGGEGLSIGASALSIQRRKTHALRAVDRVNKKTGGPKPSRFADAMA
jgi:hypothetical protein